VTSLLERHGAAPEVLRLGARVFASVSSLPAAQGVAALVLPKAWAIEDLFQPAPALVVLLAGVQDPGNAGTILRTAEAFGATGALLLEGTVHPENSKFLRASAGSAFRLPHLHGMKYGEALETLRGQGLRLYAAVPHARRTLADLDFAHPLALAIGSEGAGVPGPLLAAAEQVSIPHAHKVESLNAAMAAGIFLYEAAKARRQT
jgi:TrmH family RNA methyltransferase